jgi:hypothetical protein
VVSGAHPDLPEINDSVGRAMDALGALRDRKLLARVVWPACVTGCMVSEDKQNTFRNLVAVKCFAQGVLETLLQTHEIIDDCWKEREAGTGVCEWFSAMKSVELHLPLVCTTRETRRDGPTFPPWMAELDWITSINVIQG